jgi:predicted amidophosphoribosyltransferase
MATLRDLTRPYEQILLAPRHGPGVCTICLDLTDGYDRCYSCAHRTSLLDAVAPISYSVAHEQLHSVLASYKRTLGAEARHLRVEVAALLWRYLAAHEQCVARAAGAERFQVVTIVPSGDRLRDNEHPLHRIAGQLVGPTRERHRQILRRSAFAVASREFDAHKYIAARPLDGEAVLLIDDTWTTGANAQSAAAALKAAGSGPVAAVVIGRHVSRRWHQNNARLRALAGRFDWDSCAICAADN